MIRAVLDTSVLVSALLTPHGTTGKVLDAAEAGTFVLCLSPPILAETGRSLRGKAKRLRRYYAYTDAAIDAYLTGLAEAAELFTDIPTLRVVPGDPDDDMVVATAVAAGAGLIVTGDRHLLSLGTYGSVRMVTPRGLLDLLAT